MARLAGFPDATYDALARIRDVALVTFGSLFTGQQLWTAENFARLGDRVKRFVESKRDTFNARLLELLTGATPDEYLLAAEVLYVQQFFSSREFAGADIKVRNVLEIASQSPTDIGAQMKAALVADELDRALPAWARAAAATGFGGDHSFNVSRASHVAWIVEFMRAWHQLDDDRRAALLADPWQFRELAFSVVPSLNAYQTMREAWLYLMFPDAFENISARNDKARIVGALRHVAPALGDSDDRTLLAIRGALTPTYGAGFSFLTSPVAELWNPDHEAEVSRVKPAPKTPSPSDLCAAFSGALRDADLSFGDDHDWLVRTFIANVLTKPFVILTGLSGSGKTQLALQLGEWLGHDRRHVAAVRPDWTGPEHVFGYEDALLTATGQPRAWSVPETLEIALRAVHDPANPYVLVLDEMNLAHVERYFADMLSGIESRSEIVPNLARGDDGLWRPRPGEPARLPFPRNLIVVGTVNVDDTTFAFSPKVLDRASTIEFRVATSALPTDLARLVRPGACRPASDGHRAALLRAMTDDARPAAALDDIARELRQIHADLSKHGAEFGYRTYVEAIRLAAFLRVCGASRDEILDVFLLQRILPRLHGALTLKPVLRLLAERAAPAMPRSAAKLARMQAALDADHFATFFA